MVIKECLLKASEILGASGTDTSVLDARVLLCFALGKSDVYVMVNPDEEVFEEACAYYFELVKRRANHEPVAYITGEKEFMSLKFYVDENVLVPRPDTEHLAELAIEIINANGICDVADFCTGSGALALSVAKNSPNAHVTGYDISLPALSVAEKNKKILSVSNADFKELDVLKELSCIDKKYELVISNPPYISRQEMTELDKTVSEYEPHLALFGGEDGLDFYKAISHNAHSFLKKGGILAFEVGCCQAEAVCGIMEKDFENIEIKKDYGDIDRVVFGKLK